METTFPSSAELDELGEEFFRGENKFNCCRIKSNDLARIVGNIKMVGEDPLIADVSCGKGFMAWLLSQQGIRVVGLDNTSFPSWSCADGRLRFEQVKLLQDSLQALKPDVIYCSFMPYGKNWTPLFLRNKPKQIIHVHNNATGLTSDNDYFGRLKGSGSYDVPDGYDVVDSWGVGGKYRDLAKVRVDVRRE